MKTTAFGWGTLPHYVAMHIAASNDRIAVREYYIDQFGIVAKCAEADNSNACDANASDFTCWYVCELLSQKRAEVA